MTNIQDLVEIQRLDSELQEIEELLGDLPTKVNDLKSEEERLIKSVSEGKERSREIDMAIDKNTLEMNAIKEKIDKYKDQLFLVTNNRQYDALQHEIDHLKEQLNSVEMNTLELSEEKDSLEDNTKEAEENLESLTQDLAERRTRLESMMSESSEKKDSLEKQRSQKTENLDMTTMSRYDRIYQARNGLVVVAIQGSACGGCGSAVPPQIVAEIRTGTSVHNCYVCNRFLFWESPE